MGPETNTKSVLIADDMEELRALVARIVNAEHDFSVVGEAEDGDEALRKALELRPDVILLDLNMPGKNGLEILPELRQNLPDAAIVVFSGLDSVALAKKAIVLGADTYIEKGRAGPEMMAMVRTVAGER